MKMYEQILKKQRPNTIQFLWFEKNQEKANNSPSWLLNKFYDQTAHISRVRLAALMLLLANL